jgi:hypothetical protein
MASPGLTKLEMLNQVLEVVSVPPVSALPSAGSDTTSIAARAEDTLDRVGRRILSHGWLCNFVSAKEYTAVDVGSSVFEISVSSDDILRAECVAPGKYKSRIAIQDSKLWIADEGTADFGAAVNVYLDVVLNIDLENASPNLKELIAIDSAIEFQRRQKGSRTQDSYLAEARARADIAAQPERINQAQQPAFNPQPVLLPGQQPQGGEQQ